MAKTYSHDYSSDYDAMRARGMWGFEIRAAMIERFEREASEHLEGLVADNVGAVILYRNSEGEEAAYFDYENFWGNVYAVNARRSDEL